MTILGRAILIVGIISLFGCGGGGGGGSERYATCTGTRVIRADPTTSDLRFRIGGLTGLFMGVLAFRSKEEGLLDPEAGIEDILPADIVDPVENGQAILVRHLLAPPGLADTFSSFAEPGAQPALKGFHEGKEISRLPLAVPGVDMISAVGDLAAFPSA